MHEPETQAPLRVVVLGMHRSGTSAVTRVLNMMGLWVGPADAFPPADEANPTGYWEYREVWALNEAVLGALGATWCEVAALDLEKLGPLARGYFASRARSVVDRLDRGGPWVIKDPRLCLLFPLWRAPLGRPVCVLIHREPLAVARSLHRRDGMPILRGLALWELYNRAALAATLGLPRTVISYRELVADPPAAVRRLHGDLTRLAGPQAGGLHLPGEEDLRSFVTPALDRHPSDPRLDHAYLNQDQLALHRALRDGTALALDPVPPLSAAAHDLLPVYSTLDRQTLLAAQRGEDLARTESWLAELDAILGATFASRSWKLGAAVTGAFRRLLGRPPALTAADRHARLMHEVRQKQEPRP